MKLRRIRIEGFRGVPKSLDLSLDGKSLCLLGENGRGKSTIVDALEYWSSGRLSNFEREGYQIDAAINVTTAGPARVTCERAGARTVVRELAKPRVVTVHNEDGTPATDLTPLPILRHRTMADFMALSPGDKKRALLDLLDLSGLVEFRDTIVTSTNNAKNTLDQATRRVAEERRAVERECGDQPVLAHARRLAGAAGLELTLDSEADVLNLRLVRTPVSATAIDRAGQVERIGRAYADLDLRPLATWNAVARDRSAQAAAAITELIDAGRRALEVWPEPSCPLCLSGIDRDAVQAGWASRAVALAGLEAEFNSARSALSELAASFGGLADGLLDLTGAAWLADHPVRPRLIAAQETARANAAAIGLGLRTQAGELTLGELDLAGVFDELRGVVTSPAEGGGGAVVALVDLERVRVALDRCHTVEATAAAYHQVWQALDAFRLLAEKKVQLAVEEAIAELGSTAGQYYSRLVGNQFYTDVGMRYVEQRRGGVEFFLRFDRRFDISPPQRIVSESQLNALALAFFLARIKHAETTWRTLVLDDVVNSFDADHRMGLARLLGEEFTDWQVLFFTHDNMFSTLVQSYFSGWRFWQIVGWSPAGGPILNEGDPLKRLGERLAQGEAAVDLGGLARIALERSLSRPLEKLGLPIRFDRRGLHSAAEYRDALEKGLRANGSKLRDLPVLARMKAQSYLVNIGAHDRQADPNLSTADLLHLLDDVRSLDEAFVCADCQKTAWSLRRGLRGYQCDCGAVSFG